MELREKLIRLAHEKPELREHLLPLIKDDGDDSNVRKIATNYSSFISIPKVVEGVEWDFGDTDLEDMPYKDALKESGLPTKVHIPNDIRREWKDALENLIMDDLEPLITDWLSDDYGFTHYGWKKLK